MFNTLFNHNKSNLDRQLAEANQKIATLETWKAEATKLLEKNNLHQLELAGEITANLRGSSGISRAASVMGGRMSVFEDDFQGASADLDGIGDQIGELDRNIVTVGAAVDQTSAAIEQISASITRISQEATSRYEDIRGLAALAKAGEGEMAATTRVIRGVTSGIDDLRHFIQIIDDIAGKTAILSMNAAIQAAHAGTAGRGFAVVADEVRKLAESSAANAAGITTKLNGLIESIHKAEASSEKTAKFLAETGEKAAHAAAGFQEIEYGARELSQGGREILEGVGSLREASRVMRTSSETIKQNSLSITGKVGHLRAEATALETGLQAVRTQAADLNGSGLVLSGTTVKLLGEHRTFRSAGDEMDPSFGAVLVLGHMAWVSKIRGILDGTVDDRNLDTGDHRLCDLGRWLDGPGKTQVQDQDRYKSLTMTHETMHALARQIVNLRKTPGKAQEAEDLFPSLAARADEVLGSIRALADSSETGHVVWTPALEVGHPKVDTQHRRLVDLLNQLSTAVGAGHGRAALAEILGSLVDYTKTHFKEEEGLFTASRYPDTQAHLEKHRGFIDTVNRFQSDFESGRVVLGTETLTFLKDWLVNHIQGTDKEFVGFLE